MSSRSFLDTYRPPRYLPLIVAMLGMVVLMVMLIVSGIMGIDLGEYFNSKFAGGALFASLLAWAAIMKGTLMYKNPQDLKGWLLGGGLLSGIGAMLWYLNGSQFYIHRFFTWWACSMLLVSVLCAFQVHHLDD